MTEGIYLLHFDPPYLHAGHYLGWSNNIPARVTTHLAGNGSPLVTAAVSAGSTVTLARTWPGLDRAEERRMKNTRAVGRIYCPICRARAGRKTPGENSRAESRESRPPTSGAHESAP